jgi:hypothetical protein
MMVEREREKIQKMLEWEVEVVVTEEEKALAAAGSQIYRRTRMPDHS